MIAFTIWMHVTLHGQGDAKYAFQRYSPPQFTYMDQCAAGAAREAERLERIARARLKMANVSVTWSCTRPVSTPA